MFIHGICSNDLANNLSDFTDMLSSTNEGFCGDRMRPDMLEVHADDHGGEV
jgi:hypothetical protein